MEARDAALLAEHFNQSLRRLPGPAYYQVLKWIHRILQPANYVEIGVHKGVSLNQADPDTLAIGVDPAPDIDRELSDAASVYELTSDEFFDRYDLSDLLGGPVGLAFIDGLHLFEQVLRDFVNLERYASSDTVILLHDCLPLDKVTAARERTTDFYCGDVWKATVAIRQQRPEPEMVIVRTAPTGLCLVRGLDPGNRSLEEELPEIIATYHDLGFDYYQEHQHKLPPQIPNEEEAVRGWLRPSPSG